MRVEGLWGQPKRNARLRFGEVKGHAERVLIVATGPSARGIKLAEIERLADGDRVHVIAVNRAILYLRPNAWFTLDPDALVRPIMEGRKLEGVAYYAAVPIDYGLPSSCKREHRFGVQEGITYLQRVIGPPPNFWQGGLSVQRGRIHTGNSAYGALQIAFLMGAKKIGLLGVDATEDGYAHHMGRPRDLGLLPWQMRTATPQLSQAGVRVINGSPNSRVACFEKSTPEACIEWVET